MSVLVTGGAGFIGSNFVLDWLAQSDKPLDKLTYAGNIEDLQSLNGDHRHVFVQGEVFDVAVDLRKSSNTFGQWVGVHLSAENKKRLWVPEGFAHGFVVLSETAEFIYKTTDYYAPEYERSLLWNDPALGIQGPFEAEPKLAAKDLAADHLSEAEVFA